MGRVPQHNIYTTKDKKLVNELHILERINTILLVLFFKNFFRKRKGGGGKVLLIIQFFFPYVCRSNYFCVGKKFLKSNNKDIYYSTM